MTNTLSLPSRRLQFSDNILIQKNIRNTESIIGSQIVISELPATKLRGKGVLVESLRCGDDRTSFENTFDLDN